MVDKIAKVVDKIAKVLSFIAIAAIVGYAAWQIVVIAIYGIVTGQLV